ncbi:hypothetical protein [Alicycliphilus denitrificans]|uniref:hypothetical protein n=1 Tax=Alicycliphilus denitrificans TaxID=179636 RepID=UPI003A80F435
MAATFDHSARRFGLVQGGGHGNFGEPPHNDGMEARLPALEEAVKGLPTKADFAELRADLAKGQADMHKAIADNHRWTHGALIGIATIAVVGVLGMMGTIWNMGKAGPAPAPVAPAAQQAPIIINVPTPAAPPSPQLAPQQ